MRTLLALIHRRQAGSPLNVTPKQLRATMAPALNCLHLVVMDENWSDKAVDREAADGTLEPATAEVEGQCIAAAQDFESGRLLRATFRPRRPEQIQVSGKAGR